MSSIPLAFIGGSLPIDKSFFEILLFIVLSTAGFLLLFKFKSFDDTNEINTESIPKTSFSFNRWFYWISYLGW